MKCGHADGARYYGRLLGFALLGALTACAEDSPPVDLADAGSRAVQGIHDAAARSDANGGAGSDAASGMLPDASPEQVQADAGQLGAEGPSAMSRVRESLVEHRRWARVQPADDGFADAPPNATCSPSATMAELLAEEPVFSVDTGFCDYVTVTQPTVRSIAAGEVVKVRLWHFELSAPMPAEAHAAVFVDGLAVLDERIAIPSSGGLLTRQLRASRPVAVGAPVLFHLHNHGANSWALVEVSVGPE